MRPQLLVSRSLTPLALLAVVLLLPDDVRARQPRPLSDDAILVNVTKYVSEYEAAFTAIVAEERYEQTYQPPPRPGSGPGAGTSGFQRRTLVSDYLLVRPPGVDAWLPFRDVAEVNGRPVRDRSDRLTKLFLESSPAWTDQAARIAEESSRYNLGPVLRNINVPMLALLFPAPRHRLRFAFEVTGEKTIEDQRVVIVTFEERMQPSLIQGMAGANLMARGYLAVEPDTGRVVQTRLEIRRGSLHTDIVVTFRSDAALGMWVPTEMRERYDTSEGEITGVARYSNFRKFKVETSEIVK